MRVSAAAALPTEPPAAPAGFNRSWDWADATQRQRPDPHRHETDRGQRPPVTQRLFGCARCRCADQDHQHRDADDGANLADGAGHRRSGGVAAALGQPGQGGTAEQREGSAHPDSLQYLAGQPFTEEIGLGPDNLEIPQQAGSPDQRADADDEAVTVPVGDAAKHRRDDGGDQRGGGDGHASLQQRVTPDVVEEQHVRQQIGVEAGAGHGGQPGAGHERLDAQQRGLDHRCRVVS